MPRLNAIEKAGLALAGILVLGGLSLMLLPKDTIRAYAPVHSHGVRMGEWTERISKAGSRVYGALALSAGTGFAVMAFYRGDKR